MYLALGTPNSALSARYSPLGTQYSVLTFTAIANAALPFMRYRLSTLLIILALAPPAFGFAALITASGHPFIAAAILLWTAAFFHFLTSEHWATPHLKLTWAEWLVLLAAIACIVSLCLPTDPCFFGGCRE